MSWRRVPVLATLVVLLAVAVMVRLGFWQLDRLKQKEALLARYAAARAEPPLTPFDRRYERLTAGEAYRRIEVRCGSHSGQSRPMAGRNGKGESGWAHVVTCHRIVWDLTLPDVDAVIGWSQGPNPVNWQGGVIGGVIVPGRAGGVRIVADPPVAGLQANAKPDPQDIPNNHFSYAVQWFLFAATALAIYALALRKRLREP